MSSPRLITIAAALGLATLVVLPAARSSADDQSTQQVERARLIKQAQREQLLRNPLARIRRARLARRGGHGAALEPGATRKIPGDWREPGGPQGAGPLPAPRAAAPSGVRSLAPDVLVNDRTADSQAGSGQAEVSHAIWGNYVLAAWNDGEGFGQPAGSRDTQGYGYSTDGGATFTDGGVPPKLAGWEWTSDPVVVVNGRTGEFWYCALVDPSSTTNGVAVVKGTFSGSSFSWGTPVLVSSGSNSTVIYDKEWMAVDSTTGNLYITYTVFTSAGDRIEFKRSTNGGTSWGSPLTLSSVADNGLVQGSRPIAGPDGEVYVVYSAIGKVDLDYFKIRKSTNQGVSFGTEVVAANELSNFGTGAPGFNRERGITFPSIAVDRTNGPTRGRVYLAWNETVNWYDDPLGGNGSVVESESNDTPGTADPFTIGKDLRGTFASGSDFDYYSFAATQGTTYIFMCDSIPNNAYTMRVFCIDGTTRLAFSGDTQNQGSYGFIVWTAPASGTYTLRMAIVSGSSGATAGYHIATGLNNTHSPLFAPDRARDQRDVYVCSSPDGSSWTTPVRVNDDVAWFDDWLPEVAVSGDGRVYVTWYDWRDAPGPTCGGVSNVYLARSDDQGASWVPLGAVSGAQTAWTSVSSNIAPNQGDYMSLFADQAVVYPMWSDGRNLDPDIYGVPVPLTLPPIQVTLISADASPDRVTIAWYVAAGSGLDGTIERQEQNGPWLTLGTAPIPGNGQVQWTDLTVTPGTRYQYRLGVPGDTGLTYGGNVWVDVPLGVSFSLQGVRPNPTASDMWVSFSLPGPGRATLELVDLGGRLVRSMPVETDRGGNQIVNLTPGGGLPAGIYVVRLTYGGRSLTTRVSIVR